VVEFVFRLILPTCPHTRSSSHSTLSYYDALISPILHFPQETDVGRHISPYPEVPDNHRAFTRHARCLYSQLLGNYLSKKALSPASTITLRGHAQSVFSQRSCNEEASLRYNDDSTLV